MESSEEEDTPDEDEDDGEEYIGGDFNEEVRERDKYRMRRETSIFNTPQPGNDSGCTAVVGLLVGRDLYVANAGDSRCIVCRDGKAIEMSFDHKPEDEPERARINKAGGKVRFLPTFFVSDQFLSVFAIFQPFASTAIFMPICGHSGHLWSIWALYGHFNFY